LPEIYLRQLITKCVFYIPPYLFHAYALYFATRQFNFANEQTEKCQNWIVSGSLQQSLQQQFIMVLAVINLCARVHKHQTRATQLWDSCWYRQWFTESQAGTKELVGSDVTSW